jgi:hypothetical protein
VNSPTIRYPTPDAAPRTGRGESALPPAGRGTKTQFLPFAALPHDLRKDPRLKGNRTAIVLAAALLEYARDSSHCWPSNRRLAEDLGVCQQTVRNALTALQAAGWCQVEHGVGNPTGRLIWLCWRAAPERATPSNRLDHPLQPVGGAPLNPVGPEARSVVVEPGREPDAGAGTRSRPEIPPTSGPPPAAFYCAKGKAELPGLREQPVPTQALPPAPPAPAPWLESEPPGPPQAELTHEARPQPEPPERPAAPGPGAARPAFRTPPAGSPPRPSLAPGPPRAKGRPS